MSARRIVVCGTLVGLVLLAVSSGACVPDLIPTRLPTEAGIEEPAGEATPAVVTRADHAPKDAQQNVTLVPTASSTATPIATDTPAPTHTSSPVPTPTPTPTLTTLQALATVIVPVRDPPALAERFGYVAAPIPRVVNQEPPQFEVGDQHRFWVGDDEAGTHFAVTATLRYITPHLHMWVEDGYTVSQESLRQSAQRFENETYPTNRAFFGSEWTPGVDNDPHISVFNGRVPGVAGYFYSPNEYSRLVNPFSNEREMFFINLEVRRPGTDEYDGTLAHEFQHMIHWYNDSNEDTWVNEGLAMLAEQLNGFSVQAYADSFLQAPDTQLTAWAIAGENTIPHYGASYLFMAYVLERLGADTLKLIIRSDANGVTGFDDALQSISDSRRFDDLFADWLVANYLDDTALVGGRYGYRDLDVSQPKIERQHSAYPVTESASVHQYGSDYIELQGVGEFPLTVEFFGERITHLAPTTAHSGQWAWWSNRGDDSDTTLTRSFDLRSIESATLSAWLWYDIERDWDYAYIEVSTDGGSTWTIQDTAHSVMSNPNGNSFGPAYTGVSGGADAPQWIEERVDLTAYVGQVIALRFELVTDDAVNHPGLFIDDVAIPEIDYFEDFENDDGGWEPAGFVRTDNRLPQYYLVQIILTGPAMSAVHRLELDEERYGRLELADLGRDFDRAVLVVSGLTPVTTELALYRYQFMVAAETQVAAMASWRMARALNE